MAQATERRQQDAAMDGSPVREEIGRGIRTETGEGMILLLLLEMNQDRKNLFYSEGFGARKVAAHLRLATTPSLAAPPARSIVKGGH